MEPRGQFTFYRSYYDALKPLPETMQAQILMAVCAYALNGEAQELDGVAGSIFALMRPTLDTARRRAQSGSVGGSRKPAYTADRPEANGKQTASEKENETEKEKEIENETEHEDEDENDCSARGAARRRHDESERVMAAYCRQINAEPSASCRSELRGFVQTLGAEAVLHAIDVAADENKRQWSYLRGILRNFAARNVRSLKDAKAVAAGKNTAPRKASPIGLQAVRKLLAESEEEP